MRQHNGPISSSPIRSGALGLALGMLLVFGCSDEKPEVDRSSAPAEQAKPPAKPVPTAPEVPAPAAAPPESPPAAVPAQAVRDDGQVVRVALTGNDSLQFNLKEIRVAPDRTIRLTLTHVGVGPKESMGHNFVLLEPGTDVTDFGLKAASARETGFIPPSEQGRVLAHSAVIGGGESVTIEFEAPPPGSYDFICSFTGHFGTMRGKLIVE